MAKKKSVKRSASSKSHLKQVKLKPIKPLDKGLVYDSVSTKGFEKWIEL
jgi:hypothetical protein